MSIPGTRSRCDELIERLDEEIRRVGTDDGIAEKIGRNRGTLSNWRKQGHIKLVPDLTNLEWLGLDMEYVVTGQRVTSCSTSSRNTGELLTLFLALPGDEQDSLLQDLRGRRTGEPTVAYSVGSPETLIQALRQLPPELGQVIGQLVQVPGSLSKGEERGVGPENGGRSMCRPQELGDCVNSSPRAPDREPASTAEPAGEPAPEK